MDRKAALPLNIEARRKADDGFYEGHPEFVRNGKRIPLDPYDTAQYDLRREWMEYYDFYNTGPGNPRNRRRKVSDPCESCLGPQPCDGNLEIVVVDLFDNPIPDATVKAVGSASVLTRLTDQQGAADFGKVAGDFYDITATKDNYYASPPTGRVEVQCARNNSYDQELRPCITHRLAIKPRLIARGDEHLTGTIQTRSIPGSVAGTLSLDFGEDIEHALYGGEVLVVNPPASSWLYGETRAKTLMYKLLDVFAQNDTDGKAKRLFDTFLQKQSSVWIYTDPDLDKDIAIDENFITYPDRVLAAPNGKFANPASPRVHQALKSAGWDINSAKTINDLGVPAFNAGDKYPFKDTGDWANGLAVMIDSVEHVLVFVDDYEYDVCKQQYNISFIFELYDVFGLDSDDRKTYGGADARGFPDSSIESWWQLQHEYDYAPLITKAVVKRTFTGIPAL